MLARCQPMFPRHSRTPREAPESAILRVARATMRLSDRWETPFWGGPTVSVAQPAGAPCRATCRAYDLRPANQLWTLVRFTDQMAAAGMRNGRSQMRIDTSCNVAKLAGTLAQGRVLEPERKFNPFTRSSLSGLERELSTFFSMVSKQATRLRTEKPSTGAVRAGCSIVLAWADRV